MTIYRRQFPNKVIPKQHILEYHCMPFIERTMCGLGLLGEQGTEMSHQTVKKIEKRALGVVNECEKMKFVMKTLIIQTAPALTKALPISKPKSSKRKRLF